MKCGWKGGGEKGKGKYAHREGSVVKKKREGMKTLNEKVKSKQFWEIPEKMRV